MNRPITLVITEEKPFYIPSPTNYAHNPKKGWKHLQKLAFWFLDRIGCVVWDKQSSFTQIRVNTDKITDAMFEMNHHIKLDQNVDYVDCIIGASDFSRLMQSPEVNKYFAFGYNQELRGFDNGRGWYHVLGVRVKVVPWMQGMVFLPSQVLR